MTVPISFPYHLSRWHAESLPEEDVRYITFCRWDSTQTFRNAAIAPFASIYYTGVDILQTLDFHFSPVSV